MDLKGSEDEPAPNQYSNKAKDKLMSKSPSYTIQQGRRGGAVFWMARGHFVFMRILMLDSDHLGKSSLEVISLSRWQLETQVVKTSTKSPQDFADLNDLDGCPVL